jgi:hypothetical protein
VPTVEIDSVVASYLRKASRELRADARATRDRARDTRAQSEAFRSRQVIRRKKVRFEPLGSHSVRFVERW